ncbi:SET domain-containing protein [Trichodelitschia bisporula]|uniref:SET domain-containing protein n=1 Tax=Trichodelitschia bisporula TaxID=703511 RepID=A0A6G1HN73_9PEZI|nr:SET domain-containing protein [Trichodelitschia bisporula]
MVRTRQTGRDRRRRSSESLSSVNSNINVETARHESAEAAVAKSFSSAKKNAKLSRVESPSGPITTPALKTGDTMPPPPSPLGRPVGPIVDPAPGAGHPSGRWSSTTATGTRSSAAVSETPPTSLASDEVRRSRRNRNSVTTYNDSVLAGTAVHTRRDYIARRSLTSLPDGRLSLDADEKSCVHDESVPQSPVGPPPKKLKKTPVTKKAAKAPVRPVQELEADATPAAEEEMDDTPAEDNDKAMIDAVETSSAENSSMLEEDAPPEPPRVLRKRAPATYNIVQTVRQARAQKPLWIDFLERRDANRFSENGRDLHLAVEIEAKFRMEQKQAMEDQKDCSWPRRVLLKHGLYLPMAAEPPVVQPSVQSRLPKAEKAAYEAYVNEPAPLWSYPIFKGAEILKTQRDYKLPRDILYPLPEPQGPKWKVMVKNRYIGDAHHIVQKDTLPPSTCRCADACGDDCINRHMQYECDETNCRLDPEDCTNRQFTSLGNRANGRLWHRIPDVTRPNLYEEGVEVVETKDRGHGVRAMRSFRPNQIIVEYVGEVITQDEADRRMEEVYSDQNDFYLMTFHDNLIIDATKGSIARFVNHSCDPNCRVEKWIVGGTPRMALFAGSRGIEVGEELTYDYNFTPYSDDNVQTCRCGAANCRGILGPKPASRRAAVDKSPSPVGLISKAKRTLKRAFGASDTNASDAKRRKTIDNGSLVAKGKRALGLTAAVEPEDPGKQAQQAQSRADRMKKRLSTADDGGKETVGKRVSRRHTATFPVSSISSRHRAMSRSPAFRKPLRTYKARANISKGGRSRTPLSSVRAPGSRKAPVSVDRGRAKAEAGRAAASVADSDTPTARRMQRRKSAR